MFLSSLFIYLFTMFLSYFFIKFLYYLIYKKDLVIVNFYINNLLIIFLSIFLSIVCLLIFFIYNFYIEDEFFLLNYNDPFKKNYFPFLYVFLLITSVSVIYCLSYNYKEIFFFFCIYIYYIFFRYYCFFNRFYVYVFHFLWVYATTIIYNFV